MSHLAHNATHSGTDGRIDRQQDRPSDKETMKAGAEKLRYQTNIFSTIPSNFIGTGFRVDK